jgi:hypothetical protein
MKRPFVVVLVVALLLAIGGIAWASIPGPDGVIHGCYKTSNPAQGALIAIDSAASCPSGYTALNWSQTGPQGPAGPTGAAGPAGPAGPAGADGVSGLQYVQEEISIPANSLGQASVDCPTGKTAIAGGFESESGVDIRSSTPNYQNSSGPAFSWVTVFINNNAYAVTRYAYAVCVSAA